MRLLLDTHVWLWMIAEPERFDVDTAAVLENSANELLLSAASSWEIAIKHSLGKLTLPAPAAKYVPQQIAKTGVTPLLIEHSHALRVAELPSHHRDPFDRLLVAQAELEGVTLMTADRQFEPYGIPIEWV
ncbi:MAG TPA: type II toxin-antitoxin system VapC family toxin [Gemmatimonadaceae bacterium]|nr:type II toxin-antitoxin system VapC family toxin [Gemmatimonadaceae bacterium]